MYGNSVYASIYGTTTPIYSAAESVLDIYGINTGIRIRSVSVFSVLPSVVRDSALDIEINIISQPPYRNGLIIKAYGGFDEFGTNLIVKFGVGSQAYFSVGERFIADPTGISLNAISVFLIDYPFRNFVQWSDIGSLNFEMTKSNVAGARPLDWSGWVWSIRRLNNKIIVYGENGISALTPVNNFFGLDTISKTGLKCRGAITGDSRVHFFIDSKNMFWILSDKLELVGYSEYLSSLSSDVILSYDNTENRVFICDGTYGFIYSHKDNSLSEYHNDLTGFGYKDGDILSVGSSAQLLASGNINAYMSECSFVDGNAFAAFQAVDISQYDNNYIIIKDSSGYEARGYTVMQGDGVTYGGELLINGDFETGNPPTGWEKLGSTTVLAQETGGQSGYCLSISRLAVAIAAAYKGITTEIGALYKVLGYVKSGTGGSMETYLSIRDGLTTIINQEYIISSSAWEQVAFDFIASVEALNMYILKWNPYPGTILYDSFSVKKVLTPPATGVYISNSRLGSEYSWESIDANFNLYDLDGYTFSIYNKNPTAFSMLPIEIITDVYDFGNRKNKTINSVEFNISKTTAGDIYAAIDYKPIYGANFSMTPWTKITPQGVANVSAFGVEFRFRLKSLIVQDIALEEIKINGYIHSS